MRLPFIVPCTLAMSALLTLISPGTAWESGIDGIDVIVRVSVASDGSQANGASYDPSVSANGRYVSFDSTASNLVPGDTNAVSDVFVHDTQTGQTIRASVASDGTQANGPSESPSVSADGRYVAFQSGATNLVPENPSIRSDIFVHDMQTGQTTRVNVASDGTAANNGSSEPAISADGRYVAFVSGATNLVPGDTNGWGDVFVHDMQTGQATRVSVASDGTQANNGSYSPSVSADGRYVTFFSDATNLAPGSYGGVFVHDMQTGQTTRVDMASDGGQPNCGGFSPSISGDGRYIAFYSCATNVVPGVTNAVVNVFVRDMQKGQTVRASVASDGGQSNCGSYSPSISANGRYVSFESCATNLVQGVIVGGYSVFVRDMQTSQTAYVGVANTTSYLTYVAPSISSDGSYIAFKSNAANLVPGDTNGVSDIFVRYGIPGPLKTLYLPLVVQGTSTNW